MNINLNYRLNWWWTHFAGVDQLAIDVKWKLWILQNCPAPDQSQMMPMSFLDQIGIPNASTKITRHFRLPIARSLLLKILFKRQNTKWICFLPFGKGVSCVLTSNALSLGDKTTLKQTRLSSGRSMTFLTNVKSRMPWGSSLGSLNLSTQIHVE